MLNVVSRVTGASKARGDLNAEYAEHADNAETAFGKIGWRRRPGFFGRAARDVTEAVLGEGSFRLVVVESRPDGFLLGFATLTLARDDIGFAVAVTMCAPIT